MRNTPTILAVILLSLNLPEVGASQNGPANVPIIDSAGTPTPLASKHQYHLQGLSYGCAMDDEHPSFEYEIEEIIMLARWHPKEAWANLPSHPKWRYDDKTLHPLANGFVAWSCSYLVNNDRDAKPLMPRMTRIAMSQHKLFTATAN